MAKPVVCDQQSVHSEPFGTDLAGIRLFDSVYLLEKTKSISTIKNMKVRTSFPVKNYSGTVNCCFHVYVMKKSFLETLHIFLFSKQMKLSKIP